MRTRGNARAVCGPTLTALTTSLLVFGPASPASAQPSPESTVFVNEIHYDNDGTDAGEFVEIANTTGADLTGWDVVFYNGSNGTSYGTSTLSGTDDVVAVTFSGIQNGSPVGVALENASGDLVQFLSYEGSITGTNGVASGVTCTDIGVEETSTTPLGQSLQLTGEGATYGDFSWTGPADDSPGEVNTGQTFTGGGNPGPAEPVADCGDGTLAVDTDESGSRDVSAVDADSRIVTAEVISASVAGITLDDVTASSADGEPATDYGLANASLDEQVTGAGGWKINADENPLFDYNDTVHDTAGEPDFERKSTAFPLFEPNAFRSSDHDPVLVGLDRRADRGATGVHLRRAGGHDRQHQL